MGGSGTGPGGGPARLDDDERLQAAGRPGDLHEALAVLHPFDVSDDHAGLGIGRQRLDKIRLGRVHLVSQADELGKTDVVPDGPIQDGRAKRAGL